MVWQSAFQIEVIGADSTRADFTEPTIWTKLISQRRIWTERNFSVARWTEQIKRRAFRLCEVQRSSIWNDPVPDAHLGGAFFSEAHLDGAWFFPAYLGGAKYWSAFGQSKLLWSVNLAGATFDGAVFDGGEF